MKSTEGAQGLRVAIDVEETYRRFGPMVMRRCRQLLKDEQLALDTMHDVFVQLLVHQRRLDDRAMSSLLYRIATNLSLNKIRSKSRRPESPSSELLTRIAEATSEEDAAHARTLLDRVFGREPVSTRTIAVLHLHDGLTLKEVAEYLKLAEKTAYRLAAEGKLPGFKAGGSWRFKQSDIEKWIEEKKKGHKE